MSVTPVVPVDRLEPAQWLVEAITVFGGRVNQLMPAGFDACLRVFHRPDQGRPDASSAASWAEVAVRHGTVLHPEAQWSALAVDASSEQPETGSLDRLQLPRLAAVLAGHTTTPTLCHHALWEGTGKAPPSWSSQPRFTLPGRHYWLFAPVPVSDIPARSVELEVAGMKEQAAGGEIRGFIGMRSPEDLERWAHWHRREGFVQSPSWWWPDDRAWVVHSEVDYDSTLVACSHQAAMALLAEPEIECLLVNASTLLTAHADQVNSGP